MRPLSFVILSLLLGAFLRFHQLGVVPPGLHYDFAANAIFANEIAFNNWREVFITAYTGKEVLFFYTAGLLFKLIGSSIFVLQLTAAIYGILGIAAVYFAARQMFDDDPDAAWVAAFAAALLAFSFMHLVWSRYGERVTTQPFVQAMAIGFLFRGLNRENRKGAKDAKKKNKTFALLASSRLDFVLAGAFTGFAAYTYLSARLFPIPVAFVLLIALFVNKNKKLLITNYFLLFISALIIFAPLGFFFLQHPETFFVRYNQVIVKGDDGDLLWRGITGALGMIFISGEPYDRFNIPLKPIFDPVVGFFFVVGLIKVISGQWAVISRWRFALRNPQSEIKNLQPHSASLRGQASPISNLFLLIYTLTFLLPTALSVHDIFPSNVRAMGVMAMLTIFPAIGIVAIGNWIINKWRVRKESLFIVSLFIVHCSLFISVYNDYFVRWATTPSLHYANDTDLANASCWLNAQDTRDTDIYFSAIHYRHPTVAYLARDYANVRWYFGANALAIPEGKSLYVFPHSEPMIAEWIEKWKPIYAPPSPDGTPDFRAYKFDSPPSLIDFDSASANFGNIIEITGMRTAAPNAIDLKLRVLNLPDRGDYRLVADLIDERGFRWTQTYNDSYPSEQWQVGETILMRLKFEDQIGRPKGNYKIYLSFYSPSDKTSLSVITKSGTAAYAILNAVPISNLQSLVSSLPSSASTPSTSSNSSRRPPLCGKASRCLSH
ncbi:MAG: glycosyltransferase family 39 protein [Chloroflexi bacterium]|nr:glycosyltransferase family 39 protein [Chloroflexota bacterium]